MILINIFNCIVFVIILAGSLSWAKLFKIKIFQLLIWNTCFSPQQTKTLVANWIIATVIKLGYFCWPEKAYFDFHYHSNLSVCHGTCMMIYSSKAMLGKGNLNESNNRAYLCWLFRYPGRPFPLPLGDKHVFKKCVFRILVWALDGNVWDILSNNSILLLNW